MVDHDILVVNVQLPLEQSGRFARQLLFLPQAPQLPLPQRVTPPVALASKSTPPDWPFSRRCFTFTPEALALIVRSGEGLLRRIRNLCLGWLIEAVRDQTRIVDLKQVNCVLIQPHWRKDCDQPIA